MRLRLALVAPPRRLAAIAAAAAAAAAMAPAAVAAPLVKQLIVFPSGSASATAVTARAASVRVGGKRCAVAAGTPLAALVDSRAEPVALRDFGSCSSNPADAGSLFVTAIGGVRNRGLDGWFYKVGTRAPTVGAADPGGPFGHGPLRAGARVTWFYCHAPRGRRSCQRTLVVKARALGGGRVVATVRAYDDFGRGVPGRGATVHSGSVEARAGRDGSATLTLPAGRQLVYADAPGEVRSFDVAVTVR